MILEDFKTSATRFRSQGASPNEVEEYLADFKNLKPKIHDIDKKDIDKWKDWEQFKAYVDQLRRTKSKGQEKKEKKQGAKLVASDKYWNVYKITTHEAAQLYGAGTKWCITQEDPHYWESYTEHSKFYFYISKRLRPSSPFYKIALEVDNNGTLEYWDATDKSHGRNEERFWTRTKLGSIPFNLPDIPEVEEALKPVDAEVTGKSTSGFTIKVLEGKYKDSENILPSRENLNVGDVVKVHLFRDADKILVAQLVKD